MKQRVLITGAAGRIGTVLGHRLGDRYELSGIDQRPAAFPCLNADIRDLAAIQPAFEGIDAVVHLAANPHVAGSFADMVEHNIAGTRNVYEAAKRAGVRLVMFASTNHVVSGWEIECGPSVYALDDTRTIDHNAEIRPDSPYGFSKAAGEALGRHYVDLHGLHVHVIRIGWVLDDAGNADPLTQDVSGETQPVLSERAVRRRLRAIWLSHDDCAHLVDRSLQSADVPFGIYYGVSNNPRLFYDLGKARRDLGYAPQDSAPRELGE